MEEGMKKAVLIVDDNNTNLYLLKNLLEGEGMEVMTAENGKDALNKARAKPPDIIISDILMPVMDGYALCRECKLDERLKHIPFVFYTATYTEPKDEKFASSIGADRFILKPQEPDVFIDILKKVWQENDTKTRPTTKPLGEEMEFFRQYNEILFRKLEKKMLDLETMSEKLKSEEEELRKNEEFLDSVVENIPNMIFVKDAENLRFVRFNRAGEDLLGYGRQDLIGKNDYDFFPKEQADFFIRKDREVLENRQLVDILEEAIHTKHLGERILHTKKIPIADKEGRLLYLLGISEDITARKNAERESRKTLEKLRTVLGSVVQAMAVTVETKDPYTAGHQRRVANLARSIAQEMNLFKDVIDGIRVAGLIHDIGKIAVPAEILSKPTKLTEMEFNIIKVHSEAGYNILKDIDFPWPVADIVFQHHERIDGSGYPQGLKDGQILLEAKILAVADAVEAMASHRPYRAGLGIDFALDEIEKNKGIFYDSKIVDACVKLFREKGFRLE